MPHNTGTTPPPIRGLHHVTAIARDPKKNVAFYTRVLGLRLVKQTVNFDDPGTYHLYFADGAGTPGSVLTFFPWPNVARGELGAGETKATMFAITERSVPFWLRRLSTLRVEHDAPVQRFDETVIAVRDHDGMRLELVASGRHEGVGFAEVQGSEVPAEHALRGFAGVSLLLRSASKTIDLLTRTLGYAELGNSDGVTRLMARGADTGQSAVMGQGAVMGRIIDVHEDQGAQRGRTGSGTVHHIAFRTKDDAEQQAWQDALAQRGLHATEILDRQYFHSIYVREPGGVLLEFATDAPGFAVDEPLATLGQELKLPAQYEGMRDALRARLPALVE